MAKTRRFKLFGREILIGKRLFGYGKEDETFGLMQMTGTDTRSASKLDAYKGIVQGCVSLIGEAAGGMYEPIAYRRKGDQLEAVQHEFLELLRRPAGRDQNAESFSMFDLFEATASFIALQGECFWYMALGETSGRPREIVILRPDKVGIDIDKDTGDVNGYFIRRAQGSPIPLEVNEVLHFKQFNPKDPYRGKGTVEAADDYIATDDLTAKFTRNFFDNNAGLSGILEIKGEVTKNAFKKFVRAWRDKYEGVDAAGKVAIIRASEAAFTKVGLGLDEIDMSALRKMSQEDVAMMFRVPLALLGKLSEGTGLGRANIETLEYIFLKWNINNKFKKFDAIIDFAIERYYPQDRDLTIKHANIIPDDKEFQLNVRDKGVDRWLTRNEIRKEDGLDDAEGGDKLRAPLSSFPIDEDLSGGGSDSASTESKGIVLKIRRKVPVPEPKKKDETPPLQDSETNNTTLNSEQKETFRLSLMRNQGAYERRYKKKMTPILKDQRREALDNLEAHAGSIGKAQQKLFDDAAYDKLLTDALTPVLEDLGKEQGSLAMVFAGDDEGEFILNARYKKYVQSRTSKMAKNFNDETLDKLNKTLAEGIQAGESLEKLRKRLENVYDDAERYRTLRVARTETLNASNEATNEAYRQTGYVKGKEWYVNPDACEQCLPFEGKTIGLDETFVKQGESYEDGNGEVHENTYDDIDSPPLHPNCRCTILPVR